MKLLNLKQRFPETAKYLKYQQKRLRDLGPTIRQQWGNSKQFAHRQAHLVQQRGQHFRAFVANQSSRIQQNWDTFSKNCQQLLRMLARLLGWILTFTRIVLTIILTFIGAGLIAAVFVSENYELKRSIAVQQSPKEVFSLLQNLDKRTQWDPWFKVDTSMTTKISGTNKGKKTKLSWTGNETKEGSLQVKKVNSPKSLKLNSVSMEQYLATLQPWQDLLPFDVDFPFVKPLRANETWWIEKTDSATIITRIETGKLDYPVERWIGLLMEKDLGARFDSSLVGLKKTLKDR